MFDIMSYIMGQNSAGGGGGGGDITVELLSATENGTTTATIDGVLTATVE